MSTSLKPAARDLDADLAICEKSRTDPWIFIAAAREGWPYAIRRAQEAEREVDKLRIELDALKLELNQHHRSDCYD